MIPMLIVFVLAAVIAGILLRSALSAVLLIGLVAGIYVLSCYAFDASPRALLSEGVHQTKHVYRAHQREIRQWL